MQTIAQTIAEKVGSLDLAVTHLNAPVGACLTVAQLANVLRAGSADVIADSPAATALVRFLFVELDPRLIALCAYEAGSDIAHTHRLYQENLNHTMPRVPAWEQAVEYLI
jgi:hypothetical protein